jgi:hypothetical protein
MTSSPTTPPTPESSSSPTFISPITAPGLRTKSRQETPTPTPSPEASQEAPRPPLPDPIDTRSGDKPASPVAAAIAGGTSPWRKMTRGVVAAGSAFVHDRVAVSDTEIREGHWVASASEQAQIGDPLAAILERHGVPAGDNQDMNDLIAAGLGLVGYLMKNIARTVMARLAERRARRNAQPVVDADPETGWTT